MTTLRSAEWPTRNPAFTPTLPSRRPSHSPKERQRQSRPFSSAASGMPSTLAIMRGEVLGVLFSGGRQREAAVTTDHGGHPVKWRGARRRVPEELGVIVRVEVYEAGHDDETVGVDRACGDLVAGAGVGEHGHSSPGHPHVAPTCRSTGPVCDSSPSDQQVEQLHTSSCMSAGFPCMSAGFPWPSSNAARVHSAHPSAPPGHHPGTTPAPLVRLPGASPAPPRRHSCKEVT